MDNYKKIFFDFEVFKFDFLVVFIDYDTKEKIIIINNPKQLKEFYNIHKDDIFCGYNSRTYDMVLFKGIMQGLNAWDINNKIINENKKAFQILKRNEHIPFNNFDLIMLNKSLKLLEGFMGSKIKESSISWDINRKLTKEEIDETIEYCVHDVEQTIEVFGHVSEEFDSQLSLITAFNLPMEMFNKTKAQISAKILGAERKKYNGDEFNLTFVDTLRISEKYQYIIDWYKDPKNLSYNRSFTTDVANVPHVFGWGGLHGAINNYFAEGIILCMDIASMYPAIIIEYDFMSRNVSDRNKYREIRDTRLRLKKEKNPMQAPYKIVLNGTFGATKDEMNDLYDPLMANNICVNGQLLLLDLIEKIEPYGEIIQSNTDGIFIKAENMDVVKKIKEIAKEWEQRTRLDLEWDIYNKIYQKDVNNYIIINEKGEYKSKGAYVKQLSAIDYDLPIINNALINYFIYNKPIEETILECNELKDFQKVVKITNLYKYALHGDLRIKEKTLRVFASNKEDAHGIFKVKSEDKIEKIANTPEKCFIYNDEVNGVKCPDELNKQYYIDLANERLEQFLTGKAKAQAKLKSNVKGVNSDVKYNIDCLDLDNFNSFIDFLVAICDNKIANKKQIQNLTKINYFRKFGGNKKLLQLIEEFYQGANKYSKVNKDETKQRKIETLQQIELNMKNEIIELEEQMQYDMDLLGYLNIGFDISKRYLFVYEIEDTTYSPRIKFYSLSNTSNNKLQTMKVTKKEFEIKPLENGDIIYATSFDERFKTKLNPDSKAKKDKFIKIYDETEWWINNYNIIDRNDFRELIKKSPN